MNHDAESYLKLVEQFQEEGTPHELADLRIKMSAEFAYIAAQLAVVLNAKPKTWKDIRALTKSDTSADREWDATEDGRKEMVYRLRLKSLEKMISAAKTKLEVLNAEARQQY